MMYVPFEVLWFAGEVTMTKRDGVLKGMSSRGRTMLLKHLDGGKLNSGQAIVAKCCDCMSYYPDGRQDCKLKDCPLYPWMPYKEKT